MPAADTARLIASLELKDKFTGPSKKVLGSLGQLEAGVGRIGSLASQGARTAAGNIAKIGAVAAVGIAGAVKVGLNNLAELESAISSVDGAIDQMGQTGQISGKQIAGWANDIERNIGAAFDDKEITAAASTLIRFGKVTPKNLRPALEVMTDLAVKTGDVDSAASLLAKALADPAKAAGKLSRVGIVLTNAQQNQIKAMTEAGDVAGAQALILDELAKSTEGAAKASQGPYARSLAILKDVSEDATKALAVGFLPVISKVSDLLGKELAKPETLANIQKFGEGLAGGLDDLIEVARNLPWAQIGESLKLGAAGATTILKMFTGLPPWVQTAVLTGWGLNKLTGGALGGIVGELGKGLIKGVLGINAGVVNIKAGTVVGGGGPGAPGGGGSGVLGSAARIAGPLGIAFIAQEAAKTAIGALTGSPAAAQAQAAVGGGPTNLVGPLERLFRALGGDFRSDLEIVQDLERQQLAQDAANAAAEQATVRANAQAAVRASDRADQQRAAQTARITAGLAPIRSEMIGVRQAQGKLAAVTIASSHNETAGIAHAAQQQVAAQARTTHAAQQSAAAIRDKKLSVTNNITIPLRVTVSDQVKATLRYKNLHNTPV